MTSPRLFSYILPADSGFAPNPFFGFCTLACCKPQIRRSAAPGDWIVGISPKADGNKLVYVMRVYRKLTFADYWNDSLFGHKKPDLRSTDPKRHAGDNIYEPLGNGKYRQHPSAHNATHKKRDLDGRYVLVARDFAYFGRNAVELPQHLRTLIKGGPGHKCNFEPHVIGALQAFISEFGFRVHGKPTRWRNETCDTPKHHARGAASGGC